MTDSGRRQKKLYKDPDDRKIAGVASGVAKYFDIDTTLVRAVWVVLALGGVGILLYVILLIMLEEEPPELEVIPAETGTGDPIGNHETTPAPTPAEQASETDNGEEPRAGDDNAG